MYSVKPIIDSTQRLEGNLSSMYHIRSIYEQSGGVPQESAVKLESSEMATLEQRQDKVLAQLNELKLKLVSMKQGTASKDPAPATKASGKSKPAQKTIAVAGMKPGKPVRSYVKQRILYTEKFGPAKEMPKRKLDLVINANPINIPYSLRAIKSLWMNRLHISYTSHTHSTIAELPAAAKEFSESLKWAHLIENEHTIPIIFVTLIWKDVKQTELISAATQYIPIIGEANILRYFYRIGPNEYVRPTFPLESSVYEDAALDAVSLIPLVKDGKGRLPLWKQLNTILGQRVFFGEELLTIADMAVSSIVRQFGQQDKVPAPLLKHYQSVNSVVGYEITKDFY